MTGAVVAGAEATEASGVSDTPSAKEQRPGMTASRALRGILVLQIVLALGMLVADFSRGADGGNPLRLWPGDRIPTLEAPIAPGDQRRRFDPGRMPDLPAYGDMPSRLLFAQDGTQARLSGTIAPGDGARFTEWLEARPNPLETVALHSPGGSVDDALQIGRAVRAAGLDTEVEADRICLSACPYILAGGVVRSVGEGGAVGVHQHYFDQNTMLPAFLAVEEIQSGQAEVMAHLVEMGIDPLLMVPTLATPPEEIYVLLPEELERYRITTPEE